MPITPQTYTPRPYARNNNRLSEFLLLQGRQEADALRRQGEISANMWGTLGQTIGGAVQQYGDDRAAAPDREQARELREEQIADARTSRQLGESRLQDEDAARAEQVAQARRDSQFDFLIRNTINTETGQPQRPDPRGILKIFEGHPEEATRALGMVEGVISLYEGRQEVAAQAAMNTLDGLLDRSPAFLRRYWPMVQDIAQRYGLPGDRVPSEPDREWLQLVRRTLGEVPDPGPLVEVQGEEGPVYGTRAQAIGQPVPPPRPTNPTEASLAFDAVRGSTEARAALDVLDRNRAGPNATPTPTASLNATRALRNDFIRETSAANTAMIQFEQMQSSLAAVKSGSLAAGSQGVLVTFQKILDPTSVVRESEYARSSSGLSLLNRLEGQLQTIQKGGAGVPVAELETFVSLAEQFARNQAKYATETRAQINALAERYALDPALITRAIGPDASQQTTPADEGGWTTVNGIRIRRVP